MTSLVKRTTLALTTESVDKLEQLATAAGVSRTRLIECFAELTEEQAKKIVNAKVKIIEERYEQKNAAATAKRRELRAKINKLSPEQLEALLTKANAQDS